jgi:hypothetical protein
MATFLGVRYCPVYPVSFWLLSAIDLLLFLSEIKENSLKTDKAVSHDLLLFSRC